MADTELLRDATFKKFEKYKKLLQQDTASDDV